MARSAQSRRLEKRLAAIPVAVRQAVGPALKKSAEELQSTMRALAPEDTGDLKASIAVTLPGQSTPAYSQPGGSRLAGETEALVTVGNSGVRYGHLVEYGTAHTQAQPFFWPGFRLSRKRVERRIKTAISKAVKQHWGKP